MFRFIFLLLLIDAISETNIGCRDIGTTCNKNICSKFPTFARNSCAKTCGFCDTISSGILHRTNASRSDTCYDKDPDCSNDICRNYPYTAKERCAKFCGLCHDSSSKSSSRLSTTEFSTSHQKSLSSKSGITGSTTTIEKERKTFSSCIDKDSDCTMEICRNYPYTAKERCAKTCGLCSGDTSSSGTTTSGRHHHIGVGIDKSKGGIASTLSPRQGKEQSISSGLCFDKSIHCKKEICRKYPFTAKEECAKTCGFCSTTSSRSSSLSGTTFGTLSPSRHASIRINERIDDGITGSSGISHHSTKHETSHSKLFKDKELDCIDLNIDCTQKTCKDYPYTAKERCAKTCGFCRKQPTESGGGTTNIGSRSDSTLRGIKASTSTGDCKDEDPHCSERSCLDRPYTARTKCAKTCGFCGEKSMDGSMIDLKSPSVDNLDEGSIVSLDTDDIGSSSIRTKTTTGRHSISGTDGGISTQHSRHSSISSRTDSSRKSSSSSAHTQQPTNQPYLGLQRRYPGRTGPCIDDNSYCEKADCYKYPKFAQRYCEKTCNYC